MSYAKEALKNLRFYILIILYIDPLLWMTCSLPPKKKKQLNDHYFIHIHVNDKLLTKAWHMA